MPPDPRLCGTGAAHTLTAASPIAPSVPQWFIGAVSRTTEATEGQPIPWHQRLSVHPFDSAMAAMPPKISSAPRIFWRPNGSRSASAPSTAANTTDISRTEAT